MAKYFILQRNFLLYRTTTASFAKKLSVMWNDHGLIRKENFYRANYDSELFIKGSTADTSCSFLPKQAEQRGKKIKTVY